MATRGCIGKPISDIGFAAVYHHWDSYPTELGKTLWALYHDRYAGDIGAMTAELVDAHPAGWSTINEADWSLPIGWSNAVYTEPHAPQPPRCYCHGDRSEDPNPIEIIGGEVGSWWDLQWAYVLHPQGLDVLKKIGARFEPWALLRWSDDEPDWEAVEAGALIPLGRPS
jgi:hypothetical protein